MHDDQHGTAVVLLAALINALKVVGKSMQEIRVVVNGLGAAGTACCKILLAAGVRHLVGCDRNGAVLDATGDRLEAVRADLRAAIHFDTPFATLHEALVGADAFIGVSRGNLLKVEDLQTMARDPIVFAMANPEPEIAPEVALPLLPGHGDGPERLPQPGEQPAGVPRHLPRRARRARPHDQRGDEAGRRPRHRRDHPGRTTSPRTTSSPACSTRRSSGRWPEPWRGRPTSRAWRGGATRITKPPCSPASWCDLERRRSAASSAARSGRSGSGRTSASARGRRSAGGGRRPRSSCLPPFAIRADFRAATCRVREA